MSEKKLSVEELKKKAEKPGKDAMVLHPFYQGKIMSIGKAPVRDFSDFSIWSNQPFTTRTLSKFTLAFFKFETNSSSEHAN